MNVLATQFNTKTLLKYALPTIAMMIVMSTYVIIDGLFVANLVGEDALSAVNIVFPVINVLLAIGLMFATGGTAVMGRLMGQGKASEARAFLTLLYVVVLVIGVIITAVILSFPEEIVLFLGGEGDLYEHSMAYLLALSIFGIGFLFQVMAQSFFVLAGKPMLSFWVCLAGGISNIVLDYILISPQCFDLGMEGAAYATGIGNGIPGVFGVIYFLVNKKGTLYFERPKWYPTMLIQSAFNGVSELVTQLSCGVTTLLFNVILLALVGKAGVAAICVILYVQMIQIAVYMGYSIGVAPIISYKYGAGDRAQLKKVMSISFRFLMAASVVIIALSFLLDDVLVGIFIDSASDTFLMTKNGLHIFSFAYLFMGINVFMSGMFTAFSNGRVSAMLSLTRTLIFLVGALLLLPEVIGINGVWLAVPVAELLAFGLSIYFYRRNQGYYGY